MGETIFVATLGAHPQVVTLALDVLLQRGETIDTVYILHTAPQYPPIDTALPSLLEALKSDYPTPIQTNSYLLTDRLGALADVTTSDEIDAAFEAVRRLLSQQKYAGNRVHLCVSGGRKTMALFAAAAAQSVFDVEDRMWHLISPSEVIATGHMHAGPDDGVTLVRVPIRHWGQLQRQDPSRVETFMEQLTDAEREVTRLLMSRGLSNGELASALGKSSKTIANQLTAIYNKAYHHFELSHTPDRTELLVVLGRYS